MATRPPRAGLPSRGVVFAEANVVDVAVPLVPAPRPRALLEGLAPLPPPEEADGDVQERPANREGPPADHRAPPASARPALVRGLPSGVAVALRLRGAVGERVDDSGPALGGIVAPYNLDLLCCCLRFASRTGPRAAEFEGEPGLSTWRRAA